MCSELTPRARILDSRIPQFMQPCSEGWKRSDDVNENDEKNCNHDEEPDDSWKAYRWQSSPISFLLDNRSQIFPFNLCSFFWPPADHYGESRSGDQVHWVVAMKTNASIILCKKDVKLDQVYETFPARKKKHVHYKWNPTGLMWEGLQKMRIHQARADSACETDGQKAGRISRD